jgi:riboflavin synthase
MFSGIVEAIAIITAIDDIDGCKQFTITHAANLADLNIGASMAVNGVCLTITEYTDTTFKVTAVPETLRLTNLGLLNIGDLVNIERSLTLNTRIGGHYVQGHVDGVGKILEIATDNSAALLVKISLPEALAKYVVAKGYITLDGMSITVIKAEPTWFTVTFIPHTQNVTNVNRYCVGTSINIEVDIMGKYIEKLIGAHAHANIN